MQSGRIPGKGRYRRPAMRLASVVLAAGAGLIISEAVLRLLPSYPGEYYTWPPHSCVIMKTAPGVMAHVQGEARFIVNKDGIRADDPGPLDTCRILVMGGSAAECLYLDQNATWPYLLQSKLNGLGYSRKTWVGSIGKSGLDCRHHILQMKYLLPALSGIDMVIIMAGVNDLCVRLAQDVDCGSSFADQAVREEFMSRAFSVFPRVENPGPRPFYRTTALWNAWQRAKAHGFGRKNTKAPFYVVQDAAGAWYARERENRLNAVCLKDALPDLSCALEEYADNINTLIDLARKRPVRLLFVTQPVMWAQDLPAQYQQLLWLGHASKPGEYYTAKALAQGMARYNQALVSVCQKRGVECLDLASLLPNDTTVFYDDCHFNTPGAARVAQILAEYIMQQKK